MPVVSRADVLAMLDVARRPDGSFAAANLANPGGRVFGGQLLAQLVVVASLSSPGKQVRSIHVAFPREGALDQDVRYVATCERAGRTFDTWTIRAHQGESTIAVAVVSTSTPAGDFDTAAAPPGRPGPEAGTPVDLQLVPWETRACPGHELFVLPGVAGQYAFWMATEESPGSAPWAGAALLAHVTDLVPIATALLAVEGWSIADAHQGLATAVTTHTLWFHRAVPPGTWVLFDHRLRSITGEVAAVDGEVRDRNGSLLLSFAQESLLRVKTGR